MATEQLPSDLLSRLKDQIAVRRDNPHGKFIAVTVNELTALVECAQALQLSMAILTHEAMDKIAVIRAVEKGRDALQKLEAL